MPHDMVERGDRPAGDTALLAPVGVQHLVEAFCAGRLDDAVIPTFFHCGIGKPDRFAYLAIKIAGSLCRFTHSCDDPAATCQRGDLVRQRGAVAHRHIVDLAGKLGEIANAAKLDDPFVFLEVRHQRGRIDHARFRVDRHGAFEDVAMNTGVEIGGCQPVGDHVDDVVRDQHGAEQGGFMLDIVGEGVGGSAHSNSPCGLWHVVGAASTVAESKSSTGIPKRTPMSRTWFGSASMEIELMPRL